jgi:proteasome accessory factor C
VSTYRQVVGEVIHLVDLHGPMSLRQLAELLDVSADEIRRQVETYSYEDASAPDWVPGLVAVFVEPLDEEDPPVPSDDDRVRIVGHPDRLVLGIERFGASVFGPLYDAAADLSAREPDNTVLAEACRKLLDVFLPGVRPRSPHQADALAQLESAIRGTRRACITYSRAWEPGTVERVIEPYGLTHTGRGQELDAGPVQADGRIRTYLISRIRAVEVLDETFVRPDAADALIAANRQVATVSGYMPIDRIWVLRKWSEEFRITGQDNQGVAFEAELLPPVSWRAGLMRIAGGPDAYLDEQTLDEEAIALARRLWAHHGLDEA